MTLRFSLYGSHEWLAEHCRWVQFPAPRRRVLRGQLVGGPTFIDHAFKWGLFAWLMAWIWAPVLFWIIVIAVALLGHYPADPSSYSAAAPSGP